MRPMKQNVQYHINPKTGDPNVCRATVRGCPLGIVSAAHVDSPEECRSVYEKVMSDYLIPQKLTRENCLRLTRLTPEEEFEVYQVKIPRMRAYFASH